MNEGEHFGEIGLIYDTLRTAYVITRDFTNLGILNSQSFISLCKRYPGITKELK